MRTQYHLPAQPGDAQEINTVVARVRQHEQVAYFASGLPIFVHAADDVVGQRIVAAQLMELGLAQQDELSAALGVHRSTLYRQHRKLTTEGVLGVVDAKRGPHGPHRFTADKRRRVVELLGEGRSTREAARQGGRALRELSRRHHPIDQAPGERGLGIEAVAEQRHFHRPLHTEGAGQEEGRAAIGTGAEMAVGERIEAVLGGDREIAGHEKAHADARDRAVHAGDQRLTDAAQLQDQRMDVMDEFLEAPRPRGRRQRRYLREELDVAARHEAAAGASQYDDSHGRVGFYAILGNVSVTEGNGFDETDLLGTAITGNLAVTQGDGSGYGGDSGGSGDIVILDGVTTGEVTSSP